jgi:hypothetical protein
MSPPGPALPSEGGVNITLLVTSVLLVFFAAAALVAVLDFDSVRAIGHGRRLGWSSGGGAS